MGSGGGLCHFSAFVLGTQGGVFAVHPCDGCTWSVKSRRSEHEEKPCLFSSWASFPLVVFLAMGNPAHSARF